MKEATNVFETVLSIARMMRRKRHHGDSPARHGSGHRLLRVLKLEGSMSAKDLAQRLDIRPASLSESLDRLEEKEMIIRTQDENDKRKVIISLSGKALQKMAMRKEKRDELQEKLAIALTPEEQAEFIRLGNKLIASLSQEANSAD